MQVFSERLKKLRSDKGINQSEMKEVTGVSVQSYSSYENGREPSYEVLAKIAKYFDCTTDYLLGLSDDKNSTVENERVLSERAFDYLLSTLPHADRNTFLAPFSILIDSYNSLRETDNTYLSGLLRAYLSAFSYYVETTISVIKELMNNIPENQNDKDIVLMKYYRETNECVTLFNELSKTVTTVLSNMPIKSDGDGNGKT